MLQIRNTNFSYEWFLRFVISTWTVKNLNYHINEMKNVFINEARLGHSSLSHLTSNMYSSCKAHIILETFKVKLKK